VYGWPALRKQLQKDGSTLDESALGAVYTVGAWSTQGGRFFVGLARDRFGTKWVVVLCIFCVALGSVGVAWSDPNNAAALSVSLFLLGLGSGVQLCVQPVAGLFPKSSGTALASLSGAFQISGLVFLTLTTGDSAGTRNVRFSVFAILLVILCLAAMILLPKGKSFVLDHHSPENDSIKDDDAQKQSRVHVPAASSTKATGTISRVQGFKSLDSSCPQVQRSILLEAGSSLNQTTEQSLKQEDVEADSVTTDRRDVRAVDFLPDNPLVDPEQDHETISDVPPTIWTQMKTSEYILLCLWLSVCILPLQYYIGSIGFQLEEKGDDDGFYTDLFSILYAGSIVFSPAGGFLSDKLSLGITQGLATWMCAASFFILGSDLSLNVQAVGLLLYGIGRLLVFGMYFTNCGKRFGYTNFGTLAGLGLLVSALFSLIQYPMIAGAAHGQSTIINVGSGIVLLAQTPYFVWLHHREKSAAPAGFVSG
jgi:MFS transporter, LAT3 family, solute carrier family 43, member 3